MPFSLDSVLQRLPFRQPLWVNEYTELGVGSITGLPVSWSHNFTDLTEAQAYFGYPKKLLEVPNFERTNEHMTDPTAPRTDESNERANTTDFETNRLTNE